MAKMSTSRGERDASPGRDQQLELMLGGDRGAIQDTGDSVG
jgi:hypothetical protein